MPAESDLHSLYNSDVFRSFIAQLVGEQALFEYADPLSPINVHCAVEGQELNWHFDNSEFSIILLLQAPLAGCEFEYLRDAEKSDMNFSGVQAVIEGKCFWLSLALWCCFVDETLCIALLQCKAREIAFWWFWRIIPS